MTVDEFVQSQPSFFGLSQIEKILVVGWYLHHHRSFEHFDGAAVRSALREVHVEPPDLSVYLPRMAAKKPPLLIKGRSGYRLEGSVRRSMDARYSNEPTRVAVAQILQNLPEALPSLAEKAFLKEALACYRAGAFRATIVMVWNLAYDHIRSWTLADTQRLGAFNQALTTKYPKKSLTISVEEDFDELKEFEVIEICRVARLLPKNVCDILRDKLARRNMAAHPSSVVVSQHQADDAITDLVNNVVLKI